MFVSAASSKDAPCTGESLGNHLEGLEIRLKDISMIAQAKYFTYAIVRAGMFLQIDKTEGREYSCRPLFVFLKKSFI